MGGWTPDEQNAAADVQDDYIAWFNQYWDKAEYEDRDDVKEMLTWIENHHGMGRRDWKQLEWEWKLSISEY